MIYLDAFILLVLIGHHNHDDIPVIIKCAIKNKSLSLHGKPPTLMKYSSIKKKDQRLYNIILRLYIIY